MNAQRWGQVRDLFDAVCDLPREQWQSALAQRCDDGGIIDEVFQLLRAQTVGLSRVASRLDTALAQALAPEFGVGERLGPWRLTERIAQGGMGTVFKAERADGLYQRTVAIKLLHGLPGASEVERLAAERQVLADLQLPQVARLYDGGTTPDGHPYLVMEYIDGQPLDRYCATHKLDLPQRLRLFLDICSIVQAAHERLVLHCDLKPSNVLVESGGQPVLLDFGLARVLNDARAKEDSGYCTPTYASPELMRGAHVGAASDVYSLGVMLLELITTRPCMREPQDIDVPMSLPSAHATEGLRWKRRLVGDLDAIAKRACANGIAQRYRSVEALSADVRRYLQRRPVAARDGGRLYELKRAARRNWRAIALGLGSLTMMGAFITGLIRTRHQAEEDAAIAKQVTNFMVGVFESADPFLRTERGDEELTSRQLLDRAALQVSQDLEDAPALQARMRAVLGVAYQNSGVSSQAERLLRQAYEGFLQEDVDRPVDAASALASLSIQRTREGNGAEALVMADRGLALLGDKRVPEVAAQLYAAKAMAHTNQQQFDTAGEMFDQAQRLYESLPDKNVAVVLQELAYNKGIMHLRHGRQTSAEASFRQVLAGLHGRRTSLALAAEVRLAQILREQGQFEQALPLLQSGVRRATELYGAESSFVLMQHDALADLYRDSGDFAAADAQYRLRQRLSAAIDGADSVEYSMGLFNYGALHDLRGDIPQAEQLYRQAWMLRKRNLGGESPTSLRAQTGLGQLLMRDGRMEEAGELLTHADAGLAAALPVDAPGRVEARLHRINWHILQNQLAIAQELLDELPPQMPAGFELPLLQVRGALAERRGERAAALALRRTALEFSRSLYGDKKLETAYCRMALAETLLKFGHPRLALQELQQAAPVFNRLLLDASPDRRKAEGLMLLAHRGQLSRDV
jgi:tetratricopeptide (TPR) repeat protein